MERREQRAREVGAVTYMCVHASPDGCTAYSREVAYRDLQAEVKRSHDGIRALTGEVERLTALTDTLAGKHPDAAEMLFRERKLNETLLDLKAENERLREGLRGYATTSSKADLMREADRWKERAEAAERQRDWLADGLPALCGHDAAYWLAAAWEATR